MSYGARMDAFPPTVKPLRGNSQCPKALTPKIAAGV